MENNEIEYKNSYTGIFALNYFNQGVYGSIFTMVIPIYLLTTYGSIDQAALAFMLSIILIPTTIKIIYGILTDKVGIKNLGRRKPWIILPASFGGIIWIIVSFMIPSTFNAAVALFTIAGVIISFGIYISDTALDGFILDICPQNQLGRTQGFCWGLRTIGVIFGGPILLLFLIFIPMQVIFIILGLFMIFFSSLTLKIPHIKTPKKVEIRSNLKSIFKKSENWKLFGYSFFLTIVAGVVYTFLALYILIRMGLVNPVGATVDALEDVSLYEPQAIITLIISIGIAIGAILGGIIADKKSRRFSALFSFGFNSISLILILLPVPVPILLIFALLIGTASGWVWGAYSAIAGEYSKQYPELAGTFFSICVSFINIGLVLGFILTGITFNVLSGTTTDTLVIYGTLFIFMAILQSIGLIPFLKLDRDQYEYK